MTYHKGKAVVRTLEFSLLFHCLVLFSVFTVTERTAEGTKNCCIPSSEDSGRSPASITFCLPLRPQKSIITQDILPQWWKTAAASKPHYSQQQLHILDFEFFFNKVQSRNIYPKGTITGFPLHSCFSFRNYFHSWNIGKAISCILLRLSQCKNGCICYKCKLSKI